MSANPALMRRPAAALRQIAAEIPRATSGLQAACPQVATVPRYAWVLSGRHQAPDSGHEAGPRAEFTAFVEKFGATLLSLSALDGGLPLIARIFKRAGLPRLSLAQLVQFQAGKFDAIIASGEDIGIPIALASLFRASRTPIHMMFHGHHLESRRLRLIVPILRRMEHLHFHCLSQALKARVQSVLGIPASRCHATGYAVDTEYFSEDAAGGATVICSAGAANRDYATLAAAVAGLAVSLKIAADSTWMPPGAGITAGQWPPNVEIRSYGSYAKLRELYRQSRFVVVPMHPATHACGYAVIAEAMAMGRTVIATRTSAPPDFLRAGVSGSFVEAKDVAALRNKILELLEHPAKAEELGRQARNEIATFHSLEQFCVRLDEIIRAALQPAMNRA